MIVRVRLLTAEFGSFCRPPLPYPLPADAPPVLLLLDWGRCEAPELAAWPEADDVPGLVPGACDVVEVVGRLCEEPLPCCRELADCRDVDGPAVDPGLLLATFSALFACVVALDVC